MSIQLVLWLTIFWFTVVRALHNVTVDDSNPSIVYSPFDSWTRTGGSETGGHMLTEDPIATATFTFEGVAFYYSSPLWPYAVTTLVSLDSGPAILLDLTDHDVPTQDGGDGAATVDSRVIRGFTGLTNTQHTLVISVGEGQPFAIVDALTYTVVDPDDDITMSVSASSSVSGSTTLRSLSTLTTKGSTSEPPISTLSSSTPSPPSRDSALSNGAKAVIAVFSTVGALFVIFAAYKLWHIHHKSTRLA
ncbi:hypothetical protein D9615_010162 [Tricholomella constricta]|uniref:Uncharacterized protein n=1 Tax=Tricholomella constricta TaxID=117010 RepID=A0A8H5GRI4_9AGAR|nr:hypothetical protein D9615_010162 [Tricholomella constricta]